MRDSDQDQIVPASTASSAATGDDEVYTSSTVSTPLLESGGSDECNRAALKADPEFFAIVQAVEHAIAGNVLPTIIAQGSSGSYFARNIDNEIVGVFKPKNEEPYGPLNPKWTKWFQKCLCPCCFGRACLVPNQGYLSEAGASMVDTALQLNVVPKTKVVRLVSSSFHYSSFDRARANVVKSASERFPDSIGKHMRQGLPAKAGSFQLFVKGFKDAYVVLKTLDWKTLDEEVAEDFLFQFQKLVILDYIIRNTDRGNDNWLIRQEKDETGKTIKLTIAAIDNGLAFPLKHPDNWRAYPYHWSWLDIAKKPFSDKVAEQVLPLLEDDDFVEEIADHLLILFAQDPGFSMALYEQQMGVMRGQILNLKSALKKRDFQGIARRESPVELVAYPSAKVILQRDRDRSSTLTSIRDSFLRRGRRYKQIIQSKVPFFKNW
eukprot:m.185263 g.185263  ORF g.185263 m.185263 type:complete len:434 (+) comp18114_c0_seq5:771-2072(+)